ncbi:hypothetical protein C8A00DRAFT_14004 [Chaetomidium leptoderma]|uniref:Uncharacterized protein n=1 Tax=Chaetomidium leptoderma TaxID=669021 RepID=A0AAN6VPB2_9PEZI|nr:hypothetical protein C8A00DRAFT_14004 [Chaetomidium leptoderma]
MPRGNQGTWSSQRPAMASLGPADMLVRGTEYTPGMQLAGPGSDTKNSGIWHKVGSGTTDDPTVAWLFDIKGMFDISADMRESHVDVARKVAKANGFKCILIRKEAHKRQRTYSTLGTRNFVTKDNDYQSYSPTVHADNHMTVFMGPDTSTAMVGGHIYVVQKKDLETGCYFIKQMDDPENQRTIVSPGYRKVAEEFWLTSGAWEAS